MFEVPPAPIFNLTSRRDMPLDGNTDRAAVGTSTGQGFRCAPLGQPGCLTSDLVTRWLSPVPGDSLSASVLAALPTQSTLQRNGNFLPSDADAQKLVLSSGCH